MCYAHETLNAQIYHYHTYSECLVPCTGESTLMGIAMDGFPIMGPGINPESGKPWCQSDMDICGGREDGNGNYAYYVTVDYPYFFQVTFALFLKDKVLRNTLLSINFQAPKMSGVSYLWV